MSNETPAQAPFEETLGLIVDQRHDDGVTCSLVIRPELRNGNGVVHGGILACIADEAAWLAIRQVIDTEGRPRQSMTTSELKMDYLRPFGGSRLTVRGYVLKLGRMLNVTRIEIHTADGQLGAHGMVTYANLP